MKDFEKLRIAVAGTGYVGLSIATLLAQHHLRTAERAERRETVRFDVPQHCGLTVAAVTPFNHVSIFQLMYPLLSSGQFASG